MSLSSGGRGGDGQSMANKPNLCERNFLAIVLSYDKHNHEH